MSERNVHSNSQLHVILIEIEGPVCDKLRPVLALKEPIRTTAEGNFCEILS